MNSLHDFYDTDKTSFFEFEAAGRILEPMNFGTYVNLNVLIHPSAQQP
jgi:hypothetical protein